MASIPNEGLSPEVPRVERWEDANRFNDGFVSEDGSISDFLSFDEVRWEDANMFKDGFDSEDPKADCSNGVLEEVRWVDANIPREGLDPKEVEEAEDVKEINDNP